MKHPLTRPQLRRELQHALQQARITAVRAQGTARGAAARIRGAVFATAAYTAGVTGALARYLVGHIRAATVGMAGAARRTTDRHPSLVPWLTSTAVLAAIGLVVILAGGTDASRATTGPLAVPAPAASTNSAAPTPSPTTTTAPTTSAAPSTSAAPGAGGTAKAPVTPGSQPCLAAARAHKVAAGDTLAKIALRYDSAIEQIAADNRITNPNLIRVGVQLSVKPLCQGHVVIKPGTTLTSHAKQAGTTVPQLAAVNRHIADLNQIFAGGRLVLTEKAPS